MPWQSIHGVDIYYEITGNGSPVLFIPGPGSCLLDWENQIPAISAEHQVIAFDLRGYGRSARHSGPYTINQFAEDTAGLIKSLGLAPVHVVGTALGGMAALQLSLDFPEFVNKLVIVNSLPEVKLSSFRARWEIGQRFLLTRLFGMWGTGLVLSRRVFPTPQQSDLKGKIRSSLGGKRPSGLHVFGARTSGLERSGSPRFSSLGGKKAFYKEHPRGRDGCHCRPRACQSNRSSRGVQPHRPRVSEPGRFNGAFGSPYGVALIIKMLAYCCSWSVLPNSTKRLLWQ